MPIMPNTSFKKIISWQQVAYTQQETLDACVAFQSCCYNQTHGNNSPQTQNSPAKLSMWDITDASSLWIAAVLFEKAHSIDNQFPPFCVILPWLFVQLYNEADWETDPAKK